MLDIVLILMTIIFIVTELKIPYDSSPESEYKIITTIFGIIFIYKKLNITLPKLSMIALLGVFTFVNIKAYTTREIS